MCQACAHGHGESNKKEIFPEEFICPRCGAEIEIWSDEETTTCLDCKEMIKRTDLNS